MADNKSIDHFKMAIKEHLEKRELEDPNFPVEYLEDKLLTECCNFIINSVQKTGRKGFTDSEIFGMANHFVDERMTDGGKGVNVTIVTNKEIQPTPEEIEELKKKAREEVFKEAKEKLTKKKKPIPKPSVQTTNKPTQAALF